MHTVSRDGEMTSTELENGHVSLYFFHEVKVAFPS